MNQEHQEYVKQMRHAGKSDDEIRHALSSAGWNHEEITQLLSGQMAPPPPPHSMGMGTGMPMQHDPQQPITVVQRYSTRGIEYAIMFLSLGFGSVSLGALAHSWINKAYNPIASIVNDFFSLDAWWGVVALVTVPLFLFMFFRLHRAEKTDPSVHSDSSRRRWVQITLLVSFLWGLLSVIGYLYTLLSPATATLNSYYAQAAADQGTASNLQLASILNLVVTLVIAGGIFAYYWIDEHRQKS